MKKNEVFDLTTHYLAAKGTPYDPHSRIYMAVHRKWLRPASELLSAVGSFDESLKRIQAVKRWADSLGISWTLHTVIRRLLDDHTPKEKFYYIDQYTGKKVPLIKGEDDQWYVLEGGKRYAYGGRKKEIHIDGI